MMPIVRPDFLNCFEFLLSQLLIASVQLSLPVTGTRETPEFSRWLHEIFNARQRGDYRPMAQVGREDAEDALEKAERFVMDLKTKIPDHP